MPKFLNTVYANDPTDCTAANTGGLRVAGGAYVTKKLRADGQVTFTDSTQATSSTAAAVTIPNGGLGVGLDLRVGGSTYANKLYATLYSYAPYFQATINPGAGLIGYWNGAGSWGLGWDNSGSHTVRLGMTNSTADFQAPPGDLIFKVDGSIAPVGTVQLAAGVAARPSLNIPNGAAPDIRATGDIWAAGGHLYYYDGATNKDLTAAGSGLANPMTTLGDIIVGGASGAPARLGVGTDGQVLTLASGTPSWATLPSPGGSTLVSATLADNTTNGVVTSLPVVSNPSFTVDFWATRGSTNLYCGRITLTYDGTTPRTSLSVDQLVGTMGLSFSADVNSGNLRLLYTTTSTGTEVAIKYLVNQGAVTGQIGSVRSVTSNYTLLLSDQSIFADTTAGGFTLTLPAAPTAGITYVIKKACVSSNVLTIDGNGKAIDGAASLSIPATNRPSYTLQYDGVAWNII